MTAVAAVAIFTGVVVDIGLRAEAGTLSRRGLVLRVERPGGSTFISQCRVEPTYHPEAESERSINPIFWVVFIVVFTVHRFSPREAIRSVVLLGWDMDEFEAE